MDVKLLNHILLKLKIIRKDSEKKIYLNSLKSHPNFVNLWKDLDELKNLNFDKNHFIKYYLPGSTEEPSDWRAANTILFFTVANQGKYLNYLTKECQDTIELERLFVHYLQKKNKEAAYEILMIYVDEMKREDFSNFEKIEKFMKQVKEKNIILRNLLPQYFYQIIDLNDARVFIQMGLFDCDKDFKDLIKYQEGLLKLSETIPIQKEYFERGMKKNMQIVKYLKEENFMPCHFVDIKKMYELEWLTKKETIEYLNFYLNNFNPKLHFETEVKKAEDFFEDLKRETPYQYNITFF